MVSEPESREEASREPDKHVQTYISEQPNRWLGFPRVPSGCPVVAGLRWGAAAVRGSITSSINERQKREE